jgi:hypothetical protein
MTDLSPAAQAVLDAFLKAPIQRTHIKDDHHAIAATLRAVADEVVPEHANPVGDAHDDARHDQWMCIRYKLLAIAAELEDSSQPQ